MTRMRRSDSDVDSDPTSEVTARSQTFIVEKETPNVGQQAKLAIACSSVIDEQRVQRIAC